MAEAAAIEKPVTDYAKQRGYHVRKLVWPGRRGAPDRLFFGKGRHLLIEFKDTGEKPGAQQLKQIALLRDDGGFEVFVIDNVEDGKRIFD